MITKEKIEEIGLRLMQLRDLYIDATDEEKEKLDKEVLALVPSDREDELAVLDWIDEKNYLYDMVRGNMDCYDADGHYVPVTYRS